ncbi:pentatricopeptide repeat-containing protein At2g21090 isoform X2 [Cryptomeria japonica]|uniref:pentatricopeptide repeat-containing protein At2g21090 isoform X2 n=1 Tax=Cryptomeria japonica TaxID=3369 RepID=UPI0027DA960E|nr:pentatricopeptide repeat-containing protein At2g21090 isoform X2 [Cryptomeria japonica]
MNTRLGVLKPWIQKRKINLLSFLFIINRGGIEQVHGNATRLVTEDVTTFCKQDRFKQALPTLHFNHLDFSLYNSLLQSCLKFKDLPQGKRVHAHIILTGFTPEINVGTKLITLYAKCGSLEDGRRILKEMTEYDVVSWTGLIAAYSKRGQSKEALSVFYEMQEAGIKPNEFTFASILSAYADLEALEQGKVVHKDIIKGGFDSDVYVSNGLVNLYGKCGIIGDARKVFDKISKRETASWNAMISGYVQNGCVNEALELFEKTPERNIRTWTAMMTGYVQNGYVEEALKLFEEMPERNVVSFTAMIAGLVRNKWFDEALKLFGEMQKAGVQPSSETFSAILPAYGRLGDLCKSREVHEEIKRHRFESDVFVGSALVDMYFKCGSVENAHRVFDQMAVQDVVAWTVLVVGYASNGYINDAVKLFEKMPVRNLVSWNAMIAGYAQNGCFENALELFQNMQLGGMKPNMDTLASVLQACASLGDLCRGMEVHTDMIRSRHLADVFVASALVDMYAKCGSIEVARKVFDKMPTQDVVSWTAMIVGYAMHGYGKEALQLFDEMQKSAIRPDGVTFVGVLAACCHTGLVDDGWQYFHSMNEKFHIVPSMDHYCCMVDLLGRAGQLDQAREFINKMPIKPDASIWGSLLGACRNHNNIELGQLVAENLVQLDQTNAAHYVLLSNIYAVAGRWNDVDKVRRMMKERKVKKVPGSSWIELNGKKKNRRIIYLITIVRSWPLCLGFLTHPLEHLYGL